MVLGKRPLSLSEADPQDARTGHVTVFPASQIVFAQGMEGDSWSCRNPADKAEADGQARETRRLRGVNNHPNNMEAAPKTSNRAAVHTFNAILTLLIFLTFSTVFCAEKGGKQIERALVGGRGERGENHQQAENSVRAEGAARSPRYLRG